jgi:hypothetical protein
MFSAHDYAQKRYASKGGMPADQVVQQLQNLVTASGLDGAEAFVETLLDVLTPPDSLPTANLRSIGEWLQRAAAIRASGQQWEQAFTDYVKGLRGDDILNATEFYRRCMGTDTLPLWYSNKEPFNRTDPLVLVRPPVVRMGTASGVRGDFRYMNQEEISIGMGLFEIMAGVQTVAGYKGSPNLGILQFATADRVAKYDGMTVSRQFEHVLDCGNQRPWLTNVSAQVLPIPNKTAVAVQDAPKWNLPTQWARKQKLISIAIKDSYTAYVVVQTAPNTFTKLYTCEWTFTADYQAGSPGAATQSYVVTKPKPASGEITLTGQEPLANRQEDRVTQ